MVRQGAAGMAGLWPRGLNTPKPKRSETRSRATASGTCSSESRARYSSDIRTPPRMPISSSRRLRLTVRPSSLRFASWGCVATQGRGRGVSCLPPGRHHPKQGSRQSDEGPRDAASSPGLPRVLAPDETLAVRDGSLLLKVARDRVLPDLLAHDLAVLREPPHRVVEEVVAVAAPGDEALPGERPLLERSRGAALPAA